MIPVLSREQARAFDAEAIEKCGVPGLLLMENAGRGAADVLERELLGGSLAGKRVLVVCGTGNNGGDGFVIARHALLRGAVVDVRLVGDESRLSPDAATNATAWRAFGGAVRAVTEADADALGEDARDADAVVDALFGTGLDRPLHGVPLAVVRALQSPGAPVLAVDIPSGLHADTGAVLGAVVHAACTVTFAHYKRGLLTPAGATCTGDVFVVDIGVPGWLVERSGHAASLLEPADIAGWLTPRAADAHKYAAGHVGVLAGSSGKVGASVMVAHAALRAGAGAATICTWPTAASSLEARVVEIMTARLDEARLPESVAEFAARKPAMVAGPGFGTGDRAREAVLALLLGYDGPLVLDADALSLFAGAASELASARAKLVLTPHAGEAARLLATTSEEVEADRFAAAHNLASAAKAVVVLKGARTLVTAPDGRVAIVPTGNPALATAGAGDVLSGTVAALACTMQPFEAACAGAYVHGAAADAWAAAGPAPRDRGLLASEVADRVPDVLAGLLAGA